MTQTSERVGREVPNGAPAGPRAEVAVTVNGARQPLPAGSTIASLLAAHALDPRLVVVEHNRVILRDRATLADVPLAEGDTVEIVHFVGGG